MEDYVYLTIINERIHTYYTIKSLRADKLNEYNCMKVPLKDYPGSAYIDENGNIALGQDPKIEKTKRISRLKQYLLETDYVVIKIAEGEATKEEYAEELEKRKQARIEINNLEG